MATTRASTLPDGSEVSNSGSSVNPPPSLPAKDGESIRDPNLSHATILMDSIPEDGVLSSPTSPAGADPLPKGGPLAAEHPPPGHPEHGKKKSYYHKIKNKASENWKDIIKFRASVIPQIFIPTLLMTIWATIVAIFYMVNGVNFLSGRIPNSTLLVTVLGVVMGLLLVFRTNTSYDRFWEGRRVWGVVQTNIRNLSRFIWVCAVSKAADDEGKANDKKLRIGAMNLIVGFSIATKRYLRGEKEFKGTELEPFICHLPEFAPGSGNPANPEDTNIPLEITLHLQSFVNYCRKSEMIDVPTQAAMSNSISALIDSLTSFERIRTSPIPFAYSIHLKQTLLLYLFSLPFQLVPGIYWASIPAVFIASFTLLGIEAIGGQIENPFGYDPNDLPQDDYTDDIQREMQQVMTEHFSYDSSAWIEPYKDLSKPHVTPDEAADAVKNTSFLLRTRWGANKKA